MSITVHVHWESGQPCSGIQVTVRLVLGTYVGGTVTDSNGNAVIPRPPGRGVLLCDGEDVYTGLLAPRMDVTIRESRLVTYEVAIPAQPAL